MLRFILTYLPCLNWKLWKDRAPRVVSLCLAPHRAQRGWFSRWHLCGHLGKACRKLNLLKRGLLLDRTENKIRVPPLSPEASKGGKEGQDTSGETVKAVAQRANPKLKPSFLLF